jgi:undecaprenyl-diphosphatase
MNIHLILASLIEGITEFLPISSTAHLIIFSKLTEIDITDSYIKFYLLFIQLGALLAGAILFSKRLLTDTRTLINVCVSFIPTAIIGLILYKLFKKLLEGNMMLMSVVLILGGLIFIYLEKVYIEKMEVRNSARDRITIWDAFVIGIAQAVAIVPGVSRSGATIVAGMFQGIKKAVIIEYTFLLAIPTLGAAVVYDSYKSRDVLMSIVSWNELLVGFIFAFVSGYITLVFFKKHLPTISLTAFGWYRIILGISVMFLLY